DVRSVLHRAVGAEQELRRGAEIEVTPQPAPHEAPRALERLERGGPLLLGTEHRDVDLGVLEIRARVHLGHGHEAEARVLELPLDEHRDLFLDQLVDPLEPLALHGVRSLRRAYAYYRKLLYLSARLAFGCASPSRCGAPDGQPAVGD